MRARKQRCSSRNRKVRYRDHAQAVKALQRLKNTSTRSVIPVRVYECPRCGGYHLTSKERV